MRKPFSGVVNVDIQDSVPDWTPYSQPEAPADVPSLVYIVLDDVGFSAMEPYGGLIETPNINRIAQRGVVYTNFHTIALCSPRRSCLLTGRNHTTNGMACITEAPRAFPTPTGIFRLSAPRSPRCSGSGAGTRTWSASGICAPRTR